MGASLRVHAADATPRKRGNDHWWGVIRALTEHDTGTPLTVRAISAQSEPGTSTMLRNWLKQLVAAGVMTTVPPPTDQGKRPDVHYQLLRRPVETPRVGQHGAIQQAMWNAMTYQLKGGFSAKELALYASTEERPVSVQSAQYYVSALVTAGIVTRFAHKQRKVPHTYRVKPSAVTGPLAPRLISSAGPAVFDPNTKAIIGLIEMEEVQ
jgi:hypothetical protein